MKRLDLIFLKVFLYSLPLVTIIGIFSYFYGLGMFKEIPGNFNLLYNFSGLIFAIWMPMQQLIRNEQRLYNSE